MATRLEFQIWYADGLVQHGQTLNDWISLPDEGVLVVVEVYDRVYKGHYTCQRTAGTDYYWMLNNGEIGGHSAKYIPEGAYIKRGQLVNKETWMDIYNRACIDPLVGCGIIS